jgi:hypothetical protein
MHDSPGHIVADIECRVVVCRLANASEESRNDK